VQLLFTFFLSTAALVITPYGSELAAYPLQMATMQPLNVASIQEWQPLSFGLFLGKYLLTLLLLIFVGHIFYPLRYRLHELAMLLFGVYAACVHLRFVLIFVMLIAPIAAMFVAEWMPAYEPEKDRYVLNLAIIALLAVSAARFMPRRAELESVVAKDYPVAAVEYLRQHPMPSGMFNEYGYGGYLIWKASPQSKVFIDGRADMYEYSGVFQDYMSIINLDVSTLALLHRYNIQACLIGRKSALATLLSASPEWKPAYTDDLSEIFVRSQQGKLVGRQ
jgi:asparagine N-glycosylation enzyme membrane subunit Stt3